jgi:hypothetical protein
MKEKGMHGHETAPETREIYHKIVRLPANNHIAKTEAKLQVQVIPKVPPSHFSYLVLVQLSLDLLCQTWLSGNLVVVSYIFLVLLRLFSEVRLVVEAFLVEKA